MARILVVDDDEVELLLAKTMLEELGHELYFAKDGADALRIFRGHDIDVVITDMIMPRIDGLTLIREVRKIDPLAEVIAVSGVSHDELELAKELGVRDVLDKPVDRNKLVEAVSDAVGRAATR